MRKLTLVLVLTALPLHAAAPISQPDRDALIQDLERSRMVLLDASADVKTDARVPAAIEPTGKVVPKAQAIQDFEAARVRSLQYVRTTQDPLREHGAGTPPQITTAYQLVLMMSGHTERHTAQLLEVKASAGYPKN
jgi:hypothetical protein